nr:gloverin-like [Plodia interpunctella]
MKAICLLICSVVAASTQEYIQTEEINDYPYWYHNPEHSRYRRQLSADPKTGDVTYNHRISDNGQLFGTLGSTGESAFGKAGYKHNIFDDHRGKLGATAYGTHVISPYGSSNHLGGSMDYTGDHTKASLDVSRQIHGMTSIGAAAGARWPVGRNGDLSLQGTYNRMGRFKDYGVLGGFNYRF